MQEDMPTFHPTRCQLLLRQMPGALNPLPLGRPTYIIYSSICRLVTGVDARRSEAGTDHILNVQPLIMVAHRRTIA